MEIWDVRSSDNKSITMKKQKLPLRKAGIWLDQENAYIVQFTEGEEPVVKRIKSDVESRVRIQGETKAFARFGHSFLSDQEKKQRRQRNQREKFFKELIGEIREDDFLYLFGPGKAKEGLNNAIEKDPDFRGKVVEIGPADKMTRKQIAAKTIDFFGSELFTDFKKRLRYLKKKEGSNITEAG